MQPVAVPVTIYVVVFAGLAVTDAPVVGDKPVVGLHVYVVAPLAVNVVLAPAHMGGGALTVTFGFGLIVNVPEPVAVHPFALVTVTE